MKLGEIKIEALKLMFAGNGQDYNDPDINQLERMKQQQEYKDYLGSMNGSINRCFAVLEERRVLPVKRYDIPSGLLEGGEFDLTSISDFFDLERIVYEGADGYRPICEYYREGDVIIIKDFDSEGSYRLIYKPTLPRITSGMGEDTELPIPDRIACYIPYFIKGELFRVDEPDEASEARNWFEMSLDSISKSESGNQARVHQRFSVYEV